MYATKRPGAGLLHIAAAERPEDIGSEVAA
jgi:hypothetical protein